MATTKVSALAETTSPQANDELLLNQSGVSKKVKITNLGIGTPADNSVSTQKIANDAVTIAKLNLISTSSAPSLEAKGTSNSTSGYIQLNCSENSHGIKLLGPPHSAGANYTLTFPNNDGNSSQVLTTNGSGVLTWTTPSTTDSTKMPLAGGAFSGAVTTNSTFDGVDIATRDGVLTSTTATAAAALPKAGGAMTGAITTNSTFDGVDIATRDAILTSTTTTAGAALPKAGGTMTGNIVMGTNLVDGIDISSRDAVLTSTTTTAGAALPKAGGTLTGTVTVGANAVGTMTTDNDGSFAMSASNNFKCTPGGNFALTFTSIVSQSGNILFINSGGHTISAHANTKVDATLLATISTAGTYLLSYFSDGTNVYMTNSAAYT